MRCQELTYRQRRPGMRTISVKLVALAIAMLALGACEQRSLPTETRLPRPAGPAFSLSAEGLTYLGTLGGYFSAASDVNDNGQIVGWSNTASWEQHAFLWQNGSMSDLGTLGGNYSAAAGINDNGQVVGWSYTASGSFQHAFLWQNGSMSDLGTLGGSYSGAADVNDNGQVAGWSSTTSGSTHAFLWQNGSMTDLGTLGGNYSAAAAIDENGQVVGSSSTTSGTTHAFLWQNGSMSDLGTLGGLYSNATGINNNGQVVGWSDTPSAGPHAFLWQNGSMTDLGTSGGLYSYANGINDSGQVVGHILLTAPYYTDHAFAWQNGTMTDLDIGQDSSVANAINNHGEIVGWANQHAFALALGSFGGFLAPVQNEPVVNLAKAGSAIPVRFSLGGDQGLDIFADGYPASQATTCDSFAPTAAVEETVTAGGSTLSYSAGSGTYTYVWKTDISWDQTCRKLTLRFTNGLTAAASFSFTR